MTEEIDALKQIEAESRPDEPEPEDIETKARELGWKPEDEWTGNLPKDGLLSAEDYLERFKGTAPVVKRATKEIRDELATTRSELAELRKTAEEFRKFQAQAQQKLQQENELLVQQLEARRAQAISEGDGEAAVQAERHLAQVRAQQTQNPVVQSPEAQEMISKFLQRNPWYEQDPVMRQWAEGFAAELKTKGYPAGPAILDAVEREARAVWPQKFEGNGRPPSPDGGGRRSMQSFGKRTFDDLPDDAKSAYSKFKRLIPGLTKKEFMDQYEWE